MLAWLFTLILEYFLIILPDHNLGVLGIVTWLKRTQPALYYWRLICGKLIRYDGFAFSLVKKICQGCDFIALLYINHFESLTAIFPDYIHLGFANLSLTPTPFFCLWIKSLLFFLGPSLMSLIRLQKVQKIHFSQT